MPDGFQPRSGRANIEKNNFNYLIFIYFLTNQCRNYNSYAFSCKLLRLELMDDLAASKGEQFDAMFLDMTPKHHAGGIKMAQDVFTKAKQAEIRQFAQKAVDTQKEESAQMQKW